MCPTSQFGGEYDFASKTAFLRWLVEVSITVWEVQSRAACWWITKREDKVEE
jgi:hypothetical protein